MKITKTASGKQTIKISKKEWSNIGKQAGWMKVAYDGYSAWDKLKGTDSDDGYDAMRDYGGDIEQARRDINQQNISTQTLKTPSNEKSKFEQNPLPPELEIERKRQRSDMVKTLAEQLKLKTYDSKGELKINTSPWEEPDGYPYKGKINQILQNGVENGRWDKHLVEELKKDINRDYEISIR